MTPIRSFPSSSDGAHRSVVAGPRSPASSPTLPGLRVGDEQLRPRGGGRCGRGLTAGRLHRHRDQRPAAPGWAASGPATPRRRDTPRRGSPAHRRRPDRSSRCRASCSGQTPTRGVPRAALGAPGLPQEQRGSLRRFHPQCRDGLSQPRRCSPVKPSRRPESMSACFIQFRRHDSEMPRSVAIRVTGCCPNRTSSTARRRNSGG